MSHQTSHEVGGGQFRANKDRGVWSGPHDFALACLNNAFRADNMYGIIIIPVVLSAGFVSAVLWLFCTILYAVPIFFIQSFLGQFSSSGYISALRIAPLFKGLGYIGLAINLISLAFHGVLIAVPIMFLIHSLQPTLPWGCDAPHPWSENATEFPNKIFGLDVYKSHCDFNESAYGNESTMILSVPSVEFFRHKLTDFNFDIYGCVLLVWVAVAYGAHQGTEKIGTFLRYCTMAAISLLVIVFLRLLSLPGIWDSLGVRKQNLPPHSWVFSLFLAVITAFMTFGPGWGSVLSLASHNKFKTNILKYSWQIPICQLGILILLGMVSDMAEVHITKNGLNLLTTSADLQWMHFMTIPSTLASIDFPHLWTWMYLLMIILACFNSTLIQMFSVQTAVLDEFELLRPFRTELLIGCSAVLALVSALFCTIDGLNVIEIVVDMNLLSQSILNLILILVVLWVYGHARFQRDLKFMTNELMSIWNLNYVRFVAPVCIILIALIASAIGLHYHSSSQEYMTVSILVTVLPWIALPTYCGYKLKQASGDWKLRLSRCLKPTDWFPVDPEDRQQYDETFGDQDTSQALTIVF